MSSPALQRFLDAQMNTYENALAEIRNGRKQSHWMWYIFPQINGLGLSTTSAYYGIHNYEEAADYLKHEVMGKRLIEISNALLQLEDKTAHQIFGSPDDQKLKSSMTLFSTLLNTHPVFEAVLQKFFKGERDILTLNILEKTM